MILKYLKNFFLSPILIERIQINMSHLIDEIEDLEMEISAIGSVVDSAIVLIDSLASQIEAAVGDEVALQELVVELRNHSEKLANSVAMDTVAEDEVVEEEVPVTEEVVEEEVVE